MILTSALGEVECMKVRVCLSCCHCVPISSKNDDGVCGYSLLSTVDIHHPLSGYCDEEVVHKLLHISWIWYGRRARAAGSPFCWSRLNGIIGYYADDSYSETVSITLAQGGAPSQSFFVGNEIVVHAVPPAKWQANQPGNTSAAVQVGWPGNSCKTLSKLEQKGHW